LVLMGGVMLGALVIIAIVLSITLEGDEASATGARVLNVVPLVDG
jgi:hypothetical protein